MTFPEKFRSRRADLFLFLSLLLLAGICWALVNPRGDFPLNDDWAYSGPVQRYLAEGRLRLSDWASPPDLVPLALGIFSAEAFGFSQEALRALTLLWAVLGTFFLVKILEEAGVRLSQRLLAAGLFFFHPIAFVLSFSFHTDVPFLALGLCAIFLFQKARRGDRPGLEWAAACVAAGAALTRQTGLALPMAGTLWFLHEKKLTASRLVRLWLIPGMAVAAFYYWFLRVHGPNWAYVHYMTQETLAHGRDPGLFLKDAASRTLNALLYTSLFCVSYALMKRGKSEGTWPWRHPVSLVLGGLLLVYVLSKGLLPYEGNVFHPRGLGTLTVYDGRLWKPAFLWDRKTLWALYTLAAAWALWVFLRGNFRDIGERTPLFLLIFSLPLALAMVPGARFFDRYFIPWQTAALFLLAWRFRNFPVTWMAWAGLAFWALLSLAGTRDYFAWNRAKWDLGREAAALGLAPAEIANGFDWNAHWKYDRNMEALRREKPLDQIEEWDWERMGTVKAVISYSPTLLPQNHLALTKTYRSVLSPSGAILYLYTKDRLP